MYSRYQLPKQFSGGGGYCSGTSGTHIFLNSSQIGVNYQLFATTVGGPTPGGPVPVGAPYSGTGAAMDLGGIYYNRNFYYLFYKCGEYHYYLHQQYGQYGDGNINPLPTVLTLTPNSTQGYCTGGTGIAISLPGATQAGVSYQLLLNGVPVSGVKPYHRHGSHDSIWLSNGGW